MMYLRRTLIFFATSILLPIFCLTFSAGLARAQETAPHCAWRSHALTQGTIRECFILQGDPSGYTWTSYKQGAVFSNGDVASKDHNAIDIGEVRGNPVYAIWAGRVIATDDRSHATGCGRNVTIYHPQTNLITYMCHFLKLDVSHGQEVVAGQVLGRVDTTGLKTTGDHIHIQFIRAQADGSSTGFPLSETEIIKIPAFRDVQSGGILTKSGVTGGTGETLIRAGLFQPKPIGELNLEVAWPKIPGTNQTLNQLVEGKKAIDLPQVIGIVFSFALWLSALLAFVTIVYAGLAYIVSGANPGERQKALGRIKGVAVGGIILLASVALLNLINPSLTRLKGIELPHGGDGGIRIPGVVDSDGRKNVSGSDLTCLELITENDPTLEFFAEALCEDGTVTEGEVKNQLTHACGDAFIQSDVDILLGVAEQRCTVPGGTVGEGNDQIELTEATMGALCTADTEPGESFVSGELFNAYATGGNGASAINITDPSAQEEGIRELLLKNISAVQEFCSEEDANNPSIIGGRICSIGDALTVELTDSQKNSIVDYCFSIIPKF